jgi:RNA polymerase sigma-70 factor (ECF subfamily)
VRAVCRRVLRDEHAVDDAFQATFLVQACRAERIGRPDRLGGWLTGVARRVARKARTAEARRAAHERRAIARLDRAPSPPQSHLIEQADLRALLDEELDRLPEPVRRAVVLVDLEGCTTDEAAGRLGLPRGTVGTRVARGRNRLRLRLERRGVTLGLALAAPAMPLPASLVDSSVRCAVAFAAGAPGGGAQAGVVPPAALALAVSTLRTLALHKLSLALITLITPALLATALLVIPRPAIRGASPDGPTAEAGAAAMDDPEKIGGTWVVVRA